MKFHWLNKQGVESSDGFIVQRMHRFYYHYLEAGRILKIPVENGDVDELFLDSHAKWEPPFKDVVIPSVDMERIQLNLTNAMAFMGIASRITRK